MKKVIVYLLIAGAVASCSDKKELSPEEMKESATKIENRVNDLDSKIDELEKSIK